MRGHDSYRHKYIITLKDFSIRQEHLAVARRLGWHGNSVSRLLVVAEDRTARRRVVAFETTFGRAFPTRGFEVDRWLRAPNSAKPIAGLRFLSGDRHASSRHRIARSSVGPGR